VNYIISGSSFKPFPRFIIFLASWECRMSGLVSRRQIEAAAVMTYGELQRRHMRLEQMAGETTSLNDEFEEGKPTL
jgi:hypothetical protein